MTSQFSNRMLIRELLKCAKYHSTQNTTVCACVHACVCVCTVGSQPERGIPLLVLHIDVSPFSQNEVNKSEATDTYIMLPTQEPPGKEPTDSLIRCHANSCHSTKIHASSHLLL